MSGVSKWWNQYHDDITINDAQWEYIYGRYKHTVLGML